MKIEYDSATEISITIDPTELSRLEREALSIKLSSTKMQGNTLPERDVLLILGAVEKGQRYLDLLDAPDPQSPAVDGSDKQQPAAFISTITLSLEGYTTLQGKGLVRDRVRELTIGVYHQKEAPRRCDGGTTPDQAVTPFFS